MSLTSAAPSQRSEPCSECPVRLSDLPAGAVATFHAAEIPEEDGALLRALGLTDDSVVRVCKSGEPCIVQVRATRIGLSRAVADGVLVVPQSGQ